MLHLCSAQNSNSSLRQRLTVLSPTVLLMGEDRDCGGAFPQPEAWEFDLAIQVKFSHELRYQAAG